MMQVTAYSNINITCNTGTADLLCVSGNRRHIKLCVAIIHMGKCFRYTGTLHVVGDCYTIQSKLAITCFLK